MRQCNVFYLEQDTTNVKLSAGSWTSLVSKFVSARRRTAVDIQTSLQAHNLRQILQLHNLLEYYLWRSCIKHTHKRTY